MKKKVLLILKVLFVFLTLLVIYHTFFVADEYWNGFYYPKGNSNGNAIYSPRFQNKEECVAWAINERGLRQEDKDVPLADLWECNRNCKILPAYASLLHATQEYKQELLNSNRFSVYACEDGGFDGGDWLRGDIAK